MNHAFMIFLGLIWVTNELLANGEPFQKIYDVATNVRCRNCHVLDDTPKQFDHQEPHIMNVKGKIRNLGQACTSCHQSKNGLEPYRPPGAPDWDLPPPKMAILPATTPAQLCRQWKDPALNGDRSLEQLLHHFKTDALIRWTWNPGPGRTPSPGTHADFVKDVGLWIAAGAPCPEDARED